MRTPGTSEHLAKRRNRGLALLEQGKNTVEVAAQLGVSARTVRYWRQTAKAPKDKKSGHGPGRPSKLSPEQLRRLESELEKGALECGYSNDYWTLDRIGKLIWDLHGVRYHPSGVWHLLDRLGWSNQKPQRQPLQRDDEAIAAWKREVWPEIKKVANPARNPDFRR
jgi:transposase